MTLDLTRILGLLGLCLNLSACGFHLRGTLNAPLTFKQINLETNQPYGTLAITLKRLFESSGITVFSSPKPSIFTLRINRETVQNVSVVQSASSTTEQYRLIYTLNYEVDNAEGKALWGPKTLTVSDTYAVNQNQTLSTDQIQTDLQDKLEKDAANQIIYQLSAKQATQALSASPAHDS